MHRVYQDIHEAAVACREGCNYCCYHPVDVTFPDALVIARTLHSSPEEVERIKQGCRDYIATSSPGLAILDDVQHCHGWWMDYQIKLFQHYEEDAWHTQG